MDELKISHVNQNVVTNLIDQLIKQYVKETDLIIQRSDLHEYLGMQLDYNTKVKIKINVRYYLKKYWLIYLLNFVAKQWHHQQTISSLSGKVQQHW